MAHPHIIARRRLVTIDAAWLEPVVRALESGSVLEPGTDFHFDATHPDGIHATYRVYRKKK